jgi:uncharacterized protein YcfJ
MNPLLKTTLALATLALAGQACAQITFYEHDNYGGRSFTTRGAVEDFQRGGFNDLASSVVVQRDQWEICEAAGYGGRCTVLRAGNYPSLTQLGLNDRISSVRMINSDRIDNQRDASTPQTTNEAVAARARAAQGRSGITFYENDNYAGRSFTTREAVDDLRRGGFNDRASSVVVGNGQWEICADADYAGRCRVLRPGQYPSLAQMGMNDRVSSIRQLNGNDRISDERYAPQPMPVYDASRRGNERLYQANVTSVRAVVGRPEQRCWIEQQQVPQEQTNNAVPGGIGGALLGGILGHQIGGGSGRDVATVLGALGGAVVGSQVGKNYGNNAPAQTQGVQRCSSAPASTRPDYWDVTYTFRGQEHRVQMTSAPGPTVTVNRAGEPRA